MRGATGDCKGEPIIFVGFQSTRPLRGATTSVSPTNQQRDFNPRAPCGARHRAAFSGCAAAISIHAPLAGRDELREQYAGQDRAFQSTRPLRGATISQIPTVLPSPFQSTRPLRGATVRQFLKLRLIRISIHAPLAGRDYHRHTRRCGHRYFNPRAPCGARPEIILVFRHGVEISIHAPLAGRDCNVNHIPSKRIRFQSTRPLRGATTTTTVDPDSGYFNPRAPCGARLTLFSTGFVDVIISIHAPLAGRDDVRADFLAAFHISIHAPLAGRDVCQRMMDTAGSRFQSTRPLRGATPSTTI